MAEHLIQNRGDHPDAPDCINWHAINTAMNNLTIQRQLWVTKFVSGFCAVASKMEQRKQWESEQCPLCQSCREKTSHVIMCEDFRAYKQYHASVQTLLEWMQSNNTSPHIQNILKQTLTCRGLATFFSHAPTTCQSNGNTHSRAIYLTLELLNMMHKLKDGQNI